MTLSHFDAEDLRDTVDEVLQEKMEKPSDYVWVATALAKLAWHDSTNHMKSTEEDANTIALAQVFATLALVKKESE
jgi:hypothetical protein